MKLLTKTEARKLPPLYSQDGKGDDQKATVKFFDPMGSWTWYATEASGIDADGDIMPGPVADAIADPRCVDVRFFGLVDGFEAELGYFHLNELANGHKSHPNPIRRALGIERDLHWSPKTLAEIKEKIAAAY